MKEVNAVWSGLGYYSRAKRIHESALKIVNSLHGLLPTTAASLEKQLAGVGP
jgi:A/G-specific adenine glycosylase